MKDNKILLVRHADPQKPDYGHWLLPAGSVERGESLDEALQREMKEETRLEIKIIRALKEIIDPYTGDKLVTFLCIPLTSEIETSLELAEAKWFGLNEIQRIENIHPELKQFLIDGLKAGSFRE